MPRINERVLTSFREELGKVAAIPWQELGRSTGSGLGVGAGVLGGLGAAHGAYRGWRDARAEGEGAGGAALRALGGGAREGALGAGVGALGGALAGGVGAIARPELAARATGALEGAGGPISALSRFGQRQVHSLTGWKPEGGSLESIRGGAWDQRENARGAADALRGARAGGDEVAIGRAAERAQKAERARGTAQKVEDLGMTSLPGSLRAVKKDPIGALRAGGEHQWHGMSRPEKALFLGVPAAQLGMAAMSGDEHKGERVGEGIGNLAGMAAFGGAPLLGQVAGGVGAGMVGKLLGRGVDTMRSREGIVHRKPELEPVDNSMNIPVERSMSPAAMGQPPEGVGR